MFENRECMITLAVNDVDKAAGFYEGTLGLKPVPNAEQGVKVYDTGRAKLLVYPSQFAGTNKATAATWTVGGDVERLAADLKGKGVAFEHYDLPGVTRKGDVHEAGRLKMAWFKDPDGNIHALVSG